MAAKKLSVSSSRSVNSSAKQVSSFKKMRPYLQTLVLATVVALATIIPPSSSQTSSSDGFSYRGGGPLPDTFLLGTRYPDRNETEECRPIRLRIVRNSRLYRTALVTNANPNLIFSSADARVMSSRIQARLDALAASYHRQFSARITVLRSWSEYAADDTIGDPFSLHYEGKLRCLVARIILQ